MNRSVFEQERTCGKKGKKEIKGQKGDKERASWVGVDSIIDREETGREKLGIQQGIGSI